MRENKTIQLSGCEVKIISYLTWGEKEKIQGIVLSGASIEDAQSGKVGFNPEVISRSKYALLEIAVQGIVEAGAEKAYSREWMDSLSVEDGDKLYAAVDELSKKKVN
jgi:hypothetical protein